MNKITQYLLWWFASAGRSGFTGAIKSLAAFFATNLGAIVDAKDIHPMDVHQLIEFFVVVFVVDSILWMNANPLPEIPKPAS